MLIINEFLFDGHLIKSLIFAKKILIIKEFLFDGYLIEQYKGLFPDNKTNTQYYIFVSNFHNFIYPPPIRIITSQRYSYK